MDIALKQRLVGASVLIALAVIVLPMLLGGRPDGGATGSHNIEIPAQPPELDFETRRYPIGERTVPKPENTPEPANKSLPEPSPAPAAPPTLETRPAKESGTADANAELPRQPLPAVEIEPSKPPAVEPEPARVESATGNGGRWVVQVASFGAADNANRLTDRLRGYGYDVVTDTIRSDVGTLHRVRVGPYATEAAAAEAVKRVSSQIEGVKPRIMDLQPDKAASMTEPSDPLVRWVVQVGSFSSAANAERLVERLRRESFSAYSEEVSGSGSTIHRVRVGPYLLRDEAIQAGSRIRERLSLEGVVMSAN